MINHLCLTICLRMINNIKVQLTTHPSPQALLEITRELYIPIQSGGPRNAMQMNHLIEVKLGYPR
jgi:hypothetical protein